MSDCKCNDNGNGNCKPSFSKGFRKFQAAEHKIPPPTLRNALLSLSVILACCGATTVVAQPLRVVRATNAPVAVGEIITSPTRIEAGPGAEIIVMSEDGRIKKIRAHSGILNVVDFDARAGVEIPSADSLLSLVTSTQSRRAVGGTRNTTPSICDVYADKSDLKSALDANAAECVATAKAVFDRYLDTAVEDPEKP